MVRQEKKLLRMIYLLCLLLFINLGFLSQPYDKFALIMGVVLSILVGYSHFVIRKFYPDGDKFIQIFASVLAVVGIAMLYRIDKMLAIKQMIWVTLGITAYILLVVILPDLKSFAKYKRIYMIITLILMPLALLFGTTKGGAQNWIIIGPISFQPSEFGKIALVLYLSSVLCTYENKGRFKEDFKQLIEPALVAMFSLGCMVAQADLGTALIFFGIAITMLYVSTGKKKYVFTALGLSVVGAVIAYSIFPHIQNRVMIWRDPWQYANDQGYQIVQGLYSIASGGLFGVGLGQGITTIPVIESDMIYAIICEELGIIFAIGLMIIYFLLFFRGIRSGIKAESKFSQLIAVGFSTMIACQTLVIIRGIFSVIPLTGITLPIVSYGGSSVLSIFFTLGILQKISEEV